MILVSLQPDLISYNWYQIHGIIVDTAPWHFFTPGINMTNKTILVFIVCKVQDHSSVYCMYNTR